MCSEVKIDVNNFVFCIRFLNLFFLDFNINFNKTFWVYVVFLLSPEEYKSCWRFPLSVNFSTMWCLCHILKPINLDGHLPKWNWEFIQAFWHHFFRNSYFPHIQGIHYVNIRLVNKKWACLKATATWGMEPPPPHPISLFENKLNLRLSITFLLWKHSNLHITL